MGQTSSEAQRTSFAESGMHLLGIEQLDAATITRLLDESESYLPIAARDEPGRTDASGKIIGNLFLENSTRTRCSFTVAAHRLGATTVDLTTAGSSISKGESILDTARTLEAMGIDALVMRCKEPGSLAMVASHMSIPTINAGEGAREHPTQALLDALVLRKRLGDLSNRTVGIVGDIAHSRVARSNIVLLTRMGVDVRLIGPDTMLPDDLDQVMGDVRLSAEERGRVSIDHDLDAHLPSLDACMMLRVQFERGADIDEAAAARYRLTSARTNALPPHAIVLHPGPMNRGLEIEDAVADAPDRSVITAQVQAGVAVRMTVLRNALVPGTAPSK